MESRFIQKKEGCLILKEWTTLTGSTETGMTFVDPVKKLWRQVWMSPSFHIDNSGSVNENGDMILEGTMYPNTGEKSSPVRGVWVRQIDGTIS